jgi:hypothetical protein
MNMRAVVCTCGLLLALSVVPSKLYADQFCSDAPPFQYQFCGVPSFPDFLTVNSSGTLNGVYGVFRDFHADFASSVYALLWRNNNVIAQSAESLTNQQLGFDQMIPFFSGMQVQAGDRVELVLHVQNDPNGQQLFYSQNYLNNVDGLNHAWSQNLTQANCAPNSVGNCAFVGFEDLPLGEGSDFDYNDFRMWLYGVDVSTQASSSAPEPSSLLLLTGVPLAWALSKFRNLL